MTLASWKASSTDCDNPMDPHAWCPPEPEWRNRNANGPIMDGGASSLVSNNHRYGRRSAHPQSNMPSNALIEPRLGKNPKRKCQSPLLIFSLLILIAEGLVFARKFGHRDFLFLSLFGSEAQLVRCCSRGIVPVCWDWDTPVSIPVSWVAEGGAILKRHL